MAIVRKWEEVDDECFGPDKRNSHWEMFIFVCRCVEYSRKTRHGLKKFIRRNKTVKLFNGRFKKNVLAKVEKYFAQTNVFLLKGKP